MSPSSSCAYSVIPIVAVVPSTSTHSCSFENLSPSGNSITDLLLPSQHAIWLFYKTGAQRPLRGFFDRGSRHQEHCLAELHQFRHSRVRSKNRESAIACRWSRVPAAFYPWKSDI